MKNEKGICTQHVGTKKNVKTKKNEIAAAGGLKRKWDRKYKQNKKSTK